MKSMGAPHTEQLQDRAFNKSFPFLIFTSQLKQQSKKGKKKMLHIDNKTGTSEHYQQMAMKRKRKSNLIQGKSVYPILLE